MFREDLSRNFGFILNDVARLMRTAFDRRVKSIGADTLAVVGAQSPIPQRRRTQSELADMLEVQKATLGRLLDRMEAKGWIRREGHAPTAVPSAYFSPRRWSPPSRPCVRGGGRLRAEALGKLAMPQQQEQFVDALLAIKGNLSRLENSASAKNGSRKAKRKDVSKSAKEAVLVVSRVRVRLAGRGAAGRRARGALLVLHRRAAGRNRKRLRQGEHRGDQHRRDRAGVEVFVHDNQRWKPGTVLFRLDPQPYEIAVAGARAQMDVVRTEVMSLRAEYRAT